MFSHYLTTVANNCLPQKNSSLLCLACKIVSTINRNFCWHPSCEDIFVQHNHDSTLKNVILATETKAKNMTSCKYHAICPLHLNMFID